MQLKDSVISSVGKAKEVDDAITVMAIVARMLNFILFIKSLYREQK
jgi:hypothetical protein